MNIVSRVYGLFFALSVMLVTGHSYAAATDCDTGESGYVANIITQALSKERSRDISNIKARVLNVHTRDAKDKGACTAVVRIEMRVAQPKKPQEPKKYGPALWD